jgi:type I restriction enzyme R subunit
MPLNEADTRVLLIEPKLQAAGWTSTQVTREHFYHRNHAYTAGRIYLRGDRARRGEPRRVDYLLRCTDAFPIAVIEAKDEGHTPEAGLEQAKGYARDLGVAFAYSTNGHRIVEYDFFTHQSRDLVAFPTSDELWQRWQLNTGLQPSLSLRGTEAGGKGQLLHKTRATSTADRFHNPLLYPYAPRRITGKEPYYFQEAAILQIIRRLMRGQRRVLLTMATGTGKTFAAFQIVWKLVKSGWLNRLHQDRPGRVLFLADRVVLRDQAYNTFSSFATDEAGDPRFLIKDSRISLNHDLYFAIYQTLWSEDKSGERLFQEFPAHFFDLVIIDEAHRSGFGTWREILDHFRTAIHLGMTATPKQDENVDTYAYFCSEEPEVAVDSDDLTLGTWRPPAYAYSLGQGIEDGFLATYKVHQIRTTLDKAGLHVEEAREQGADIYIPEGSEPREHYHTPQFEREITLPDRTKAIVDHLAGLLRRFGPTDKTMVFCVDMAHAQLVTRLLNDHFGHLGLQPYAVPIISEEGQAPAWLEQFQDSDSPTPVVATTAELLSTGVDVPSCRNIVFVKTLASPVLFKQIIGRGSRVDPATDKLWFRVIDYTDATRLFDKWDRPPGAPTASPQGPRTATLEGTVVHAETGDLLVGATVAVLTGPNEQQGPILTDEQGAFRFTHLPAGSLTLVTSGPGFRRRQFKVETLADDTVSLTVDLQPEGERIGKIKVEGLEVTIAEEATFLVEATGQRLSLEAYLDYTRQKVVSHVPHWTDLRTVWVDPDQRRAFLEDLHRASVHVDVLAEVLGQPEADQFDLLAHITFDQPVRTRSQRATAFTNREQRFVNRHTPNAREVILALLDKYRVGGVEEMTDPRVFRLSPFREMGQAVGVIRRFGDVEHLQATMREMQQRLYVV